MRVVLVEFGERHDKREAVIFRSNLFASYKRGSRQHAKNATDAGVEFRLNRTVV